ncbi:MAG: thioredoxin domain-containing protein [Acidobacteria bacterium]|nr:thioredoxin domain-containing protein [Acidobacteriota bacterium]
MHRTALLLALCAGAFAQQKAKSALDKPTLEAYLRHQFMLTANLKVLIDDPKPSDLPGMLSVDVVVTDGGSSRQQVQFYISKDGSKIVQGKVFDVRESPFAGDLKLLKTEGQPAAGPAGAKVTLVVFSDFQCQYCREEAKTLRQNLQKSYANDVRLVFKDLPLEQIHPWAKPAAVAGRCIFRQNQAAFWDYHDWIFEQQSNITSENLKSKVLEFASGKPLDTLQLTQCIDAKSTEKEVDRNTAESRVLQISSTPTLFVNGRRLVGNVTWEQLRGVIDYEIDYARRNPVKEEPCCEVKLAIPVQK